MNLLFTFDYIKPKNAGYIASGYICYQKHLEAEIKRQQQTERTILDEYVGEIGQRLQLTLTVLSRHFIDGEWGCTTLHIMTDNDGHTFIWFASNTTFDVGQQVNLKGTIKEHREYANQRQTILTRCKLIA